MPRSRVLPVQGLLALALCLLALAAACRARDDSWQRIQQSGVLRVGLDPTYPPFEMADAAGVHGLDVDLMNAIARQLGLEAEFVYFGYDGLYDALSTGQVDVLASALVVSVERTRDFAYSQPYFNAGEVLIVPAQEAGIREMAQLNGRVLAVELGARGHVEGTAWARRLPQLQLVPYNSADEAMAAVARGEADAALVDSVGGRLFLSQQPDLKRVPEPVTAEPYALVVRKEDRRLLEVLNESLESLQQAGELDAIAARWLDVPAD